MFRLGEFQALQDLPEVAHTVALQCPFGASMHKLTSWLTAYLAVDDMPKSCAHQAREWHGAGGETFWGKRPPGSDAVRFFSSPQGAANADFDSSTFVSSKHSAYPDLLNRYLAV